MNLFTNLKTQEDFAAWLKITKKHKAFFLNEILVNWYEQKTLCLLILFKKFVMLLKFFILSKIFFN